MTDEVKALHDQRTNDLHLTLDFKEPERVPICTEVLYWPLAYANVKIADIQGKPEKHRDAFCKVFDDMYTDAIGGGGVSVCLDLINTLGSKSYFVSGDEITVQHSDGCIMDASEYDNYIADPVGYPVNTLAPRRLEKLAQSDEEVKALLKQACEQIISYQEGNRLCRERLEGEKGIVYFQGGGFYAPVDYIFDYIRGFRNTILDMRRNPEKLLKACEAYMNTVDFDAYTKMASRGYPPILQTPVHSLPFLSRTQFEKFWVPYYKPFIEAVKKGGGKIKMRGEGQCEYCLDFFADSEKGFYTWQFDRDDPYKMYEKYGDKFVFQCGIDNVELGGLTKEKCLDIAKKAVDTFAPGGGFIFSTQKIILCANEVKAENIIAVHQFVHEYGKY